MYTECRVRQTARCVILQISVSQPLGPGINYTGPREVLLEFVILVFYAIFMNKCFIVETL